MIGDDFAVDIAGAAAAGWDQMYFNPRSLAVATFVPTYEIRSLADVNLFL